MRIIGYIEHPSMKITVFHMNNRYSVKFELGLYEQTYKFRESTELDDFDTIQRLIDNDYQKIVLECFATMHQTSLSALKRLSKEGETELEEII